MYSVLLLIASFGALSGLYVLLDAPFVAVMQIIVYAGAIMVLFLFVVMLLNAPQEDTAGRRRRSRPLGRAGPCGFGALLALRARRRARVGAVAARGARRFAERLRGRGRRSARSRRSAVSLVHRLRVRVRGHVDPDPGRDGRRRRARRGREPSEAVVMPRSTTT